MNISKFNPESYSALVERWLKAEHNGEQFPVDFDAAWQIAGYSTKQKGKNKLKYLTEGSDFLTDWLKNGQRGRSSELIRLTCDAFKHFCLMAETQQGKQVRQYFIEAEKKWKLVQVYRPEIAEEIDLIKAKTELAREQRLTAEHSRVLFEKREAIAQLHGAEMLALIDNRPDARIPVKEKVTETVICKNGQTVSFVGKSLAELGKELGFKSGVEFRQWLIQHKQDSVICQGMRAIAAEYIPEEFIEEVKAYWAANRKSHGYQLLMGDCG